MKVYCLRAITNSLTLLLITLFFPVILHAEDESIDQISDQLAQAVKHEVSFNAGLQSLKEYCARAMIDRDIDRCLSGIA